MIGMGRFRSRNTNKLLPSPGKKRGRLKGNRAVNTPNGLSKRNLGRWERLEKDLKAGLFLKWMKC
jgi:hypothetical protein